MISRDNYKSGWWFGTFLLSHILGILIIPIDELIFFRGVEKNHQPDDVTLVFWYRIVYLKTSFQNDTGHFWVPKTGHMKTSISPTKTEMGVSIVMGVPQNRWVMMDNPNLKWMIWGYSYFRKPPYG